MKIEIDLKGFEDFTKALKNAEGKIPTIAREVVDELSDIGLVDNYASTRKKQVVELSNEVRGGIENDNPNVLFAEYGTGTKADPKAPITYNGGKHSSTYDNTGGAMWYVPTEQVDHDLPYSVVKMGDIEYYLAHGQKAQHKFLEATERMIQSKDEVVRQALERNLG
jgi:uncharacterized surface anchored protein